MSSTEYKLLSVYKGGMEYVKNMYELRGFLPEIMKLSARHVVQNCRKLKPAGRIPGRTAGRSSHMAVLRAGRICTGRIPAARILITRMPIRMGTPAYGMGQGQKMGWFKFIIYFQLFASAVINAALGITAFTGSHYDGKAELVYAFFPGMSAVDKVYRTCSDRAGGLCDHRPLPAGAV